MGPQQGLPVGLFARWTVIPVTYPLKPPELMTYHSECWNYSKFKRQPKWKEAGEQHRVLLEQIPSIYATLA